MSFKDPKIEQLFRFRVHKGFTVGILRIFSIFSKADMFADLFGTQHCVIRHHCFSYGSPKFLRALLRHSLNWFPLG